MGQKGDLVFVFRGGKLGKKCDFLIRKKPNLTTGLFKFYGLIERVYH